MLPQRSEWEEIVLAVPEIVMIQPRGFRRLVIASESYSRTKGAFARALAAAIGTVCVAPGDPVQAKMHEYLLERLSVEPPIYIEDDVAGSGCCAVCGKRAALGRCTSCGLLMHVSRVPPRHPGGVPECPRCQSAGLKAEDPDKSDAGS